MYVMSDLFNQSNCFEPHFGVWTSNPQCSGLVANGFTKLASMDEHAETQRPGVIGVDFNYSANIQFGQGGDGHLQFRISDEGCYGVSLRESGFRVYKQMMNSWQLLPKGDKRINLAANVPHSLSIKATGSVLNVKVNNFEISVEDEIDSFQAGRFGLYAYRVSGSNAEISFSNVRATTNPEFRSNFSLLYNTMGSPLRGTKRALVRTLNNLESGINLKQSGFSIRTPEGKILKEGSLIQLKNTYGMQLWEADFSSFSTPGTYILSVHIATGSLMHDLESTAFVLEERGFTRRMLKPLTILNAEARNAAEEDLRKNWVQRTPGFYVEPDGAFRVDNANDHEGSLIERTLNGYLGRIPNNEFADGYTLTGRITILNGCDAQLQFGIGSNYRYGVTLQAGSGGGCIHGRGSGAVRLHSEGLFTGFQTLAAYTFPPDNPVRAGFPHDLRIKVERRGSVTVFVDGTQRMKVTIPLQPESETFGLKVWSGSARFENVAAWRPGVEFRRLEIEPGVWIEHPLLAGSLSPCDGSVFMADGTESKRLCSPLFTQRRGFHDCNNYIAESNSHGAFLAGLAETWTSRRDDFSSSELKQLRRAILTAVHYLERLYYEAGGTGRYKHEEPGRGGGYDKLENSNEYLTYLTLSGVYGEAAFAAKAYDIDINLAKTALRHAWNGSQWLTNRNALPNYIKALLYHQFAVSAYRDPSFNPNFMNDAPPPPGVTVSNWLDTLAINAGEDFLIGTGGSGFANLNTLRTLPRDTGQMIPWLEGIYELRTTFPERTLHWDCPLKELAENLADYLLANNGFHVIPQSSGDKSSQHTMNWDNMEYVPLADRPVADGRHFYNSTFFATMADDMVMLGIMTGNPKIEKLAAAHLSWILGLNPGIPVTKAVKCISDGTQWKGAAFVQNFMAPFSRGFENFPEVNSAKSWLWGGEDFGRHREVWWIDPLQNGFMTIVNGHTIWEREWDYYNNGKHGWASGETFMLNDGLYVKAAIKYEDWVSGSRAQWTNAGSQFEEVLAIPNQDSRIELIAGRADGTLWHRWQKASNGTFDQWHLMDGYVTKLFSIRNQDGRIELFGRDIHGVLLHRWQVSPNGAFAQWHSLEGSIKEGFAIHNSDNRIEIFVIWSDGSIHHRWQVTPNGPFAPWHSLGGSAKKAVAGMNLDRRLEIFIQSPNGSVYHRWQTAPNSFFSDWHSLGGNIDGLTVARNKDGRMEIFAKGLDNSIYHRWQKSPNGPFAGWHFLGGSVRQIQSVENDDGRIELIAIAKDFGILRNIQSVPNGPFIGWEPLGSNAKTFCIAKQGNGCVTIFAIQIDGELWYISQKSPGSWV